MAKYEFVRCANIEKYNVEEVVSVVPKIDNNHYTMCLIKLAEDKPIQNYIKLHEATTEQLLHELHNRLGDK